MLRYVVRRLLLLVPILLGVSILIFFWVHALPGNPASALLGERATPELVKQYKERYGLDRPLPVQYWDYLKVTLHGDLGDEHHHHGEPWRRRSGVAFRRRSSLRSAAMIFAVGIGLPLGFFAAKRYGGVFDHLSLVGSLIGISIPIFFLAIILKYFFAVRWQLLTERRPRGRPLDAEHPTGFYILDAIITRDWTALWDAIQHLILPAIALGSIPLAMIMRITRASVLDVQNEDYVRTARAKGLPPRHRRPASCAA